MRGGKLRRGVRRGWERTWVREKTLRTRMRGICRCPTRGGRAREKAIVWGLAGEPERGGRK